MKIDRDFRAVHELPNGRRVTLRLLTPGDREQLREGYARLSYATRYLRFHGTGPKLTEELLDRLMDTDDENRLAIVAFEDSLDLKSERGVGIARFIRLADEPSVAEAAVTVADDAQGQGIGRLLLTTLADAARERHVKTFRGNVLAANEAMRHLVTAAGAVLREDDGDTLVFDIPLEPAPHNAVLRLLRAMAKYLAGLRAP